jgi:hypothetical protein
MEIRKKKKKFNLLSTTCGTLKKKQIPEPAKQQSRKYSVVFKSWILTKRNNKRIHTTDMKFMRSTEGEERNKIRVFLEKSEFKFH